MKKMWTYKHVAVNGQSWKTESIDKNDPQGTVGLIGYFGPVSTTNTNPCNCCKNTDRLAWKCFTCGSRSCGECLFFVDENALKSHILTCYFCIDQNCTGDAYVKERATRIDSYRVDGDKYKAAENELNKTIY